MKTVLPCHQKDLQENHCELDEDSAQDVELGVFEINALDSDPWMTSDPWNSIMVSLLVSVLVSLKSRMRMGRAVMKGPLGV